jgi:hypothetical protein
VFSLSQSYGVPAREGTRLAPCFEIDPHRRLHSPLGAPPGRDLDLRMEVRVGCIKDDSVCYCRDDLKPKLV